MSERIIPSCYNCHTTHEPGDEAACSKNVHERKDSRLKNGQDLISELEKSGYQVTDRIRTWVESWSDNDTRPGAGTHDIDQNLSIEYLEAENKFIFYKGPLE